MSTYNGTTIQRQQYSYGMGVANQHNSKVQNLIYGGDQAFANDITRAGRKNLAPPTTSAAPFATTAPDAAEDSGFRHPIHDVSRTRPKDFMEPKPGSAGYDAADYLKARVDNQAGMQAAKARHQSGAGNILAFQQ